MSVQAITSALALRGVTASEKLLLLALANYADEHMTCWPSQSRLAADTCLSDRTVRSLLKSLEGRGLVSREDQRRNDGSRKSDRITLHLSGTKQQPENISVGTETISGGVRKPFPGATEIASGLTTFEPSVEPSKEPSRPAAPRGVSAKFFDEFWLAYPKRVAKGAAKKAYPAAVGKIKADDPHRVIMEALAVAKRAWVGTEPRYIPHAATWLNQDRWEDEPLAESPATPSVDQMKPPSEEYLAQRRALLKGAR